MNSTQTCVEESVKISPSDGQDRRCAPIENERFSHANENTLVKDSDRWQLHPAIQPLEHERIVHKHRSNAFDETSLDQELRARGVRQLIITGMLTHGCVRATRIGAHQLAVPGRFGGRRSQQLQPTGVVANSLLEPQPE